MVFHISTILQNSCSMHQCLENTGLTTIIYLEENQLQLIMSLLTSNMRKVEAKVGAIQKGEDWKQWVLHRKGASPWGWFCFGSRASSGCFFLLCRILTLTKTKDTPGQGTQGHVALSWMLKWNYHEAILRTTEKQAYVRELHGVMLS